MFIGALICAHEWGQRGEPHLHSLWLPLVAVAPALLYGGTIEFAHAQSALGWELGPAIPLGRMWGQGHPAMPVVAKRHGVSEQTIYVWRKRFGSIPANEVRRLRQLEAENARLKKLVAERDLEIEVMKEVASKNW